MTTLQELADKYNDLKYFINDPVIYPRHFKELYLQGNASLQDVEIAALLCAHLAWGRREMIVRDCKRLMDEMNWQPFNYIMDANYRCDSESLHRTIKWCEIARIMANLKAFYSKESTLEILSVDEIRVSIFGRKPDLKAANKKIHMFRRWLVRNDNIVDLGLWSNTDPANLIIPLDVHVHRTALDLGITSRKSADITTAMEITNYLKEVFPGDPCKGDFALFANAASKNDI
ncbi:MAG: hypothetical protein A2X19_05465 [Bacteroidetes bacterium GWE2_39_28]|nr:MAG: hypothetical protein A2X19_05465 [Bacteroidetes bacterium GWE2_39_28]OFY15202.1 MAG: hypothetical protein A2X16_08635 [Bacteroidetes bacterium GWF2_39_10]OFZ07481.1 MAG: hypothetical protein A2322_08775 [Bacteroidetes bacterium RIFOXYB2_FULL_39_7]OFZ09777.1 MAG: hypothetical protein A2465_07615 [Bacteroidetes bacterium RIFOXYC2_FULL_39_11]HCT93828.1 hypothetical protein [Rikenellaceae bacterium]